MGITGYKQTKETMEWCKKKIKNGKWQEGKNIPSLSEISKKTNVSIPTVRKVIKELENEGLLGSNSIKGYSVIPTHLVNIKNQNINKFYFELTKIKLNIANELNNGGHIFNEFIVRKLENDNYKITNIFNGIIFIKSLFEINEIVKNPLTIKKLLNMNNNEIIKSKKIYKQHSTLRGVSEFILRGLK